MTEGALYITCIFMNRFRSNRLNFVLLNLYPEQWKQVCVPGGTQQSFIRVGSALRPNPVLLPFLTEKVPLSYTFLQQMGPLSHTLFRTLRPS